MCCFPVTIGGSTIRTESPIDLLERIKNVHEQWIKVGHRSGNNTNNVSGTISIKPEEWEQVGEWMWKNRDSYNGLSVLPYDGGSYVQAPFETIDKERFDEMFSALKNVDLTGVVEMDDMTDLTGELACAGGACEVV